MLIIPHICTVNLPWLRAADAHPVHTVEQSLASEVTPTAGVQPEHPPRPHISEEASP